MLAIYLWAAFFSSTLARHSPRFGTFTWVTRNCAGQSRQVTPSVMLMTPSVTWLTHGGTTVSPPRSCVDHLLLASAETFLPPSPRRSPPLLSVVAWCDQPRRRCWCRACSGRSCSR
jgi:hypothetical protein